MDSSPVAPPFPVGADDARSAARAAADRAGVCVLNAHSLSHLAAAAELWRSVWNPHGEAPVSAEVLRALAHAGNYVAVAVDRERVVAALLGFFAADAGGVDHLHSHILGAAESVRGRGLGTALKLDQRAWALERGLRRITWTYDPLVRVNGRFNVVRLGADGAAYQADFYGAMSDTINGSDPTDRILIDWDLLSARACAAAAGRRCGESHACGAAATALESDGAGRPVTTGAMADVVLCATPPDILAVRRVDAALATEWRLAVRAVLGEAFAQGLRITGMTGDGAYVLTRVGAGEPAPGRDRVLVG